MGPTLLALQRGAICLNSPKTMLYRLIELIAVVF